MMGWFSAGRRHLRPLVILCLAGALAAYAAPAKRFIRISFSFDPDPEVVSLKGNSETWYSYPALYRWVDDSEGQRGRVELGKLVVSRESYVEAEFNLPAIDFDKARLDASAWEETTPKDAGSKEPGWADDSHDGVPCLARWYRYKKPVILEWDRRLYLTITTEPQGCRAYVKGRLMVSVSVAGLTFNYPLRSADYRQGYVVCDSFVLVRYGYLPLSVQYRYGLDPAREQSQSDIQRFDSYKLERDPAVPAHSLAPPAYAQRSNRQYDVTRAKAYDGAVADFEQALVEWEAAMRDCTKAGLDAKAVDRAAASGAVAPGVAGSPAKDEAVRRLRAAREAVDRLRARVQTLESK